MFPEYQELISRQKTDNPRFLSLFNKHHELDNEIARVEGRNGWGYSLDIVHLKKKKLQLKEELLRILQQESLKESTSEV